MPKTRHELRAWLACKLISIAIKVMPASLRTKQFINNAMMTGHIKGVRK